MEAHLLLRPDRSEVATARQFAATTLSRWQSGHDEAIVLLLVSELVTNAVIHAETDIVLTLRWEGSVISGEVEDRSDRMPIRLRVAATATSGRGVHLVGALADNWGSRRVAAGGKVVWFTVGVGNRRADECDERVSIVHR